MVKSPQLLGLWGEDVMSCILPTEKSFVLHNTENLCYPLQMADPHNVSYHRGPCVQLTVCIYVCIGRKQHRSVHM